MHAYWLIVIILGFLVGLCMAVRSLPWRHLGAHWKALRSRRQRPLSRMPAHELALAFGHRPEAFEPYRRRGTISEDELIEEIAAAMLDGPDR